MLRRRTFLTLWVLFAAPALAVFPCAIAGPLDAPGPVEKTKQAGRWKEIRSRLGQPVTLENGIEANTTLKDALEFISGRHSVAIFVNTEAFKKWAPTVWRISRSIYRK